MAQRLNNQHYCTKGISEWLPIMTQIILWKLIDSMKVDGKYYLQVFTHFVEDGQQKIVHEQEFPEYSAEHLFPCSNSITAKIFVIDYETHSTTQNDIIFCDRCRCEFTRDSAHYFEDEYFYLECIDEATVVCNHCGEKNWADDNNGTDSFPLCQRC